MLRWNVRRMLPLLLVMPVIAVCQAEPDPCATSGQMPGDVSLQLTLKDGQTQFREGEIITLIAQYSSSAEKKYFLNTRENDRSGRLSGMEVFCINPTAGRDPLSDYFGSGMGFAGGGLGGLNDLSRDPYAIKLELNEWKSLPPGAYRLRIASFRVTMPADKNHQGFGGTSVPLWSNEVSFQVIPADAAWQAEQLTAVVRTLNSVESTGEEARHAARILRFLRSEGATRELARRFWSGNDQPFGWDLKFGLFGSPDRQVAIEAMKTAIHDPHHAVTQEFVQALALLEVQSDPKYQLPNFDDKNKEAWTKAREARDEAQKELIASHMNDLATALPQKAGEARAIAVNELLQSDVTLSHAMKAQLRQILVASWDLLPVRRRNELIEYRWDDIGGPELLPILQHIVSGEPNRDHQPDKPDRAAALRQLYEVAPGEGREFILREIAEPAGDIGIDVLGLLPERELPQVEPLVGKLKSGYATDVVYQLLERYAGERVLSEVQTIYDAKRGKWACAPQNAMLQYFLRVSPDFGVDQVRDALSQRTLTGCYKLQLAALKEDVRRPALEELAITALNDPSLEVTINAAEALQSYGSPKAEAALWKKLERFHAQPKDETEMRLEQALVQAIANGQAWLASEETVQKLKALTSPPMQPQLDGILQQIRQGEYGIQLGWWRGGSLDYNVGRYTGIGMAALNEKLAQFPSSTHLNMVTTVAERDRHRAEFDIVIATAGANGLILQIQTPR